MTYTSGPQPFQLGSPAWGGGGVSGMRTCMHTAPLVQVACACALHSHEWSFAHEQRVLALVREAQLTRAESTQAGGASACTQSSTSAASPASTNALPWVKFCICVHLLIACTAQFEIGHGPVVGDSPGVGDPWLTQYLAGQLLCYLLNPNYLSSCTDIGSFYISVP